MDQTPNPNARAENIECTELSVRHALNTLLKSFSSLANSFSILTTAVVQLSGVKENENDLEDLDNTATGESLKTLLQQLQKHV